MLAEKMYRRELEVLIASVAEISSKDDIARLNGSDLLTNSFGLCRVLLYEYLFLLCELFFCPKYS